MLSRLKTLTDEKVPTHYEVETSQLPNGDKHYLLKSKMNYADFRALDLLRLPYWAIGRIADKFSMPKGYRWVSEVTYSFDENALQILVKEY